MRSVPLGCLPDVKTVMEVAETQAALTHNTPHGIHSSIIVGLASFHLLHGGKKAELVDFIETYINGYHLSHLWTKYVPCHGISTAKAAISVITRTDSMLETLLKSVAFGGDTDSTASIALGLQDCYSNKVDDLPQKLVDDAGNINYGLDFCLDLDSPKNLRSKMIDVLCFTLGFIVLPGIYERRKQWWLHFLFNPS
jgi:ADP-ribosylglycohydrolase